MDDLTEEWKRWCEWQQLECVDAEEQLFSDLTTYQRIYVTHFILRWEEEEKNERQRSRLT